MCRVLVLVLALAGSAAAHAASLLAIAPDTASATQQSVELRFDAPVQWRWFRLQNPERVVIDVDGVDLPNWRAAGAGIVDQVRFGELANGLRIVLDLQAPPQAVSVAASATTGLRVQLDTAPPVVEVARPIATPEPVPQLMAAQERAVVVVIDPGHGGKDPGAIGPTGLQEKHVALSIARELRDQLRKKGGYDVVLTRDGDEFLALRDRVDIARKAGADLFVSIHADAFDDRRAHGSSVYVLSRRGASSEYARLLAQRENAADLVGGVALQDKDETLAAVLLDISQSAALEASVDIASRVLGGMRQIGPVHKSDVQRAGFVVLKSPDVPSILVETAFISNPREERQLGSLAYRRKLATALAGGIENYFREYRPAMLVNVDAEALEEPREYLVRAGDTLSAIADRHGVSVRELRSVNGLSSDVIRVGQRIRVPLRTALR